MEKAMVAFLGSGNIATDLMMKVARHEGPSLPEGVRARVALLKIRLSIEIDSASLMLGYAGVESSCLLHARRASDRFGVDVLTILAGLGRRKVVGGQEDSIIDVAHELASRG